MNPDGSFDSSFGVNGVADIPSEDFYCFNQEYGSVIVQSDGKVVLAASINNPTNNFALVRLNANGTMDSTFDGDGIVTTNFSTLEYADYARDVLQQSDGKLLAVGNSLDNIAMARYLNDGSLDFSLGNGGKVNLNLNGENADAYAVDLQNDGKIVITGRIFSQGLPDERILLMRFLSDGTPDFSFGTNGYVITSLNCSEGVGEDLLLDNNKIYVGGGLTESGTPLFAVIRYLNDECPNIVADFYLYISDLTIQLTDQSSGSVSWFWDFGDGNTSSVQSPTHTYAAEGIYTVCLTITDSCSENIYCQDFSVCNPLNTDFLFEAIGLSCTFLNQSTEATSFFWDFGDGATSTDQNPVHTFSSPGTYHVCLVEWDDCSSDTMCQDISIVATGSDGVTNPDARITTFPNPFSDQMILEYQLKQASKTTLQLTDLSGKILYTFFRKNGVQENTQKN